MRPIVDLINDCDPTDANFCMDSLDCARKLAKWGQYALNAYNGNQHMGRDVARELAVAITDFGQLIHAFENGSPTGKEADDFHKEIVSP